MTVTLTDFFCGAGGSSTGAVSAGVTVKMAANHWQRAIETHSTNHPLTDHDIADLQATHPSRYERTNIAWFSPECTNHSLAKGRKRKNLAQLDLWSEQKIDPAEERSRATMREVVEFTAFHRYDFVIVENVVDIRYWMHYDEWLKTMLELGYEHRVLYLNAQFFAVPQSRDRIYIVFWRKGLKTPDLDFRPPAWCPRCEKNINAVQVWKKPGVAWGRYGARRQYVYRCSVCGTDVEPHYVPASSVIDWSLPAPIIGQRSKPLKPKTMQRILAGIRKYAVRPVIADLSYSHAADNGKVSSIDGPLPTSTTRQTQALIQPFLTSLNHSDVRDRAAVDPLPTVMSQGNPGLVVDPFITPLRRTGSPKGINEPLDGITAGGNHHGLIMPPMLLSRANQESPARSADEPLFAVTTGFSPDIVMPPFMPILKKGMIERGMDEPLTTIATEIQHGLVMPSFLTSYYSREDAQSRADEPMPTLTAEPRHALVMSYYGANPVYSLPSEPLSTLTTVQRHGLISAPVTEEEAAKILPECGFRMLEPEELKLGMSFPAEYIITGNKRERVRQVGNAVACNVAQWIIGQCIPSLNAAC